MLEGFASLHGISLFERLRDYEAAGRRLSGELTRPAKRGAPVASCPTVSGRRRPDAVAETRVVYQPMRLRPPRKRPDTRF